MAENSKIEWTDHTFNPWEGCTKVSDGCKHCYAERRADWLKTVKWGPDGVRRRTSDANWKKPFQWNRLAKKDGRRLRVFCASLADVFERNDQLTDWRRELFRDVIAKTPNLDWLLLTKRPDHAVELWPELNPPENVCIGTSVENQKSANDRIPHLLNIPAKIRFLSCEPLLGPVDFFHGPADWGLLTGIHWVIVGGESGANARPMHFNWAVEIHGQCMAANVPFFFKQWGEFAPHFKTPRHAATTIHPGHVMLRVGKKQAGRLLDGREWNEFPGGGN